MQLSEKVNDPEIHPDAIKAAELVQDNKILPKLKKYD